MLSHCVPLPLPSGPDITLGDKNQEVNTGIQNRVYMMWNTGIKLCPLECRRRSLWRLLWEGIPGPQSQLGLTLVHKQGRGQEGPLARSQPSCFGVLGFGNLQAMPALVLWWSQAHLHLRNRRPQPRFTGDY